MVSAGMGRSVVFWNSYTMNVLARRDGHAASVRHCLVDDDSDRVITISADKAVRCWDSATFRCIQVRPATRVFPSRPVRPSDVDHTSHLVRDTWEVRRCLIPTRTPGLGSVRRQTLSGAGGW